MAKCQFVSWNIILVFPFYNFGISFDNFGISFNNFGISFDNFGVIFYNFGISFYNLCISFYNFANRGWSAFLVFPGETASPLFVQAYQDVLPEAHKGSHLCSAVYSVYSSLVFMSFLNMFFYRSTLESFIAR